MSAIALDPSIPVAPPITPLPVKRALYVMEVRGKGMLTRLRETANDWEKVARGHHQLAKENNQDPLFTDQLLLASVLADSIADMIADKLKQDDPVDQKQKRFITCLPSHYRFLVCQDCALHAIQAIGMFEIRENQIKLDSLVTNPENLLRKQNLPTSISVRGAGTMILKYLAQIAFRSNQDICLASAKTSVSFYKSFGFDLVHQSEGALKEMILTKDKIARLLQPPVLAAAAERKEN